MQAHHTIQNTLNDLRADIVKRLTRLMMVFDAIAIYIAIAQTPILIHIIVILSAAFVVMAFIHMYINVYPHILRHVFLWSLNLMPIGGMLLIANTWLPFLGLLLPFVSSLLVSRTGLISGGTVLATAFWLNHMGERNYPVLELGLFLLVSIGLAWGTINALYTTLLWYSSMQRRAYDLLQEARDNRAQLKRTLKSLETADNTRYRMQRELVELTQQIESARRMKERFAAHISHELRTPLNLILGFSEVMYLSPETYVDTVWSPTLRRDVYQIYRSSRHLLEMIDDILDLSHFELTEFTINVEPTPLNPFLEDTVEIARNLFRNPSITLQVEIEPNLPLLEIDRTRIRQVLLNLLNNAQRFTTHGYVWLRVYQQPTGVRFAVEDTGKGIPADKLTHIFDEFYQVDYSLSRNHGGVGLGLAITKRFVEAHKGHVEVASIENKGSTFTFTLPFPSTIEAPPHFEEKGDELVTRPTIKPTVIVVDSDPMILALFKRTLDHFDVVQVATPEELSSLIEAHRPAMIIYNRHSQLPTTTPLFPSILNVPWIECSLPSRLWISHDLPIIGCLVKPVITQQVIEMVKGIDNAKRILIVDDDRGFIQLIERMLQTYDATLNIYHAYDGNEALAMMKSKQPNLVFLDLALPEVDGKALLHEIKRHPLLMQIPIVLLTATSYLEVPPSQLSKHITLHHEHGLSPAQTLQYLRQMVEMVKTHPQPTFSIIA